MLIDTSVNANVFSDEFPKVLDPTQFVAQSLVVPEKLVARCTVCNSWYQKHHNAHSQHHEYDTWPVSRRAVVNTEGPPEDHSDWPLSLFCLCLDVQQSRLAARRLKLIKSWPFRCWLLFRRCCPALL